MAKPPNAPDFSMHRNRCLNPATASSVAKSTGNLADNTIDCDRDSASSIQYRPSRDSAWPSAARFVTDPRRDLSALVHDQVHDCGVSFGWCLRTRFFAGARGWRLHFRFDLCVSGRADLLARRAA